MTAKSPPKTLTPEARKIWLTMNRLFEFDYEGMQILAVALEAYDMMNLARVELISKGFVIDTEAGGRKANPALQALNTSRDGFLRAWKYLGLNVEPPHNGPGRPPGQWPST